MASMDDCNNACVPVWVLDPCEPPKHRLGEIMEPSCCQNNNKVAGRGVAGVGKEIQEVRRSFIRFKCEARLATERTLSQRVANGSACCDTP